jgi:imidazolonepropionase-like amidohydrolase
MRTSIKATLAFSFVASAALAAPRSTPLGDDDDHYVAIKCGKLVTGTGEEKEKVTLLLKNGKVELIGEKVELPHPCEVVDASKLVVMPGFTHVYSRLSLLDYQRNGMRADLKVADEFLPAPDAFDAALANGFTTVQLVAPGTSGITGRCMVVRTADVGGGLVVKSEGALKASLLSPAIDRRVLSESLAAAKREIEKVEKARADFEAKKKAAQEAEAKKKEEEAKKQQQGAPQGAPSPQPNPAPPPPSPPPHDVHPSRDGEPPNGPPQNAPAPPKEEQFQPPPIAPPLQPLVDLIQKKPGAFAMVRLGGSSTYLHYLEATKDFEIAHVLYPEVTRALGRPQAFFGVSGTDLQWTAKKFGENKELVVLAPYLSYSQGSVDFVNVPRLMVEAGARLALTPANDSADELGAWRFNVNELVKGGLKRADAIAAITKNAAEAIGMSDRLGTLEVGKDGDLVILSGDPFDVQSSVERVLIEGKTVWTREKSGAKARS